MEEAVVANRVKKAGFEKIFLPMRGVGWGA